MLPMRRAVASPSTRITIATRPPIFNVGTAGRALQYTVNLTLPGEKEPHTYSNTLTLEPSRSYHLTVKLDDETKSKLTIGIIVDGTLVDEKTSTEIINPYEFYLL